VNARSALLEELCGRYIWWRDRVAPSEDRIIAQVMNLGTYEDMRRLESLVDAEELAGVMVRAQAGWISPRSWNFWRGRLRRKCSAQIPPSPPRRSFYDAAS
jgi:hypothetical protein